MKIEEEIELMMTIVKTIRSIRQEYQITKAKPDGKAQRHLFNPHSSLPLLTKLLCFFAVYLVFSEDGILNTIRQYTEPVATLSSTTK